MAALPRCEVTLKWPHTHQHSHCGQIPLGDPALLRLCTSTTVFKIPDMWHTPLQSFQWCFHVCFICVVYGGLTHVCVGVLVDHGSPTIAKSHRADCQEMDFIECCLFHVVGIPAHSLSLFCADNMLGRQKLGIYLRRMRENVCSIPKCLVLLYCLSWLNFQNSVFNSDYTTSYLIT